MCGELRNRPADGRRDAIIADVWLLVNTALCRYVRFNSRATHLDPEDVRDIASEKSLAFLKQVLDPENVFVADNPGRVCAYFSTLARNALIDRGRQLERQRNVPLDATLVHDPLPADPEARLAGAQFAQALREAVLLLNNRTRTIWFFRVLLDMSSREIARHPDIQMNATAVDMALSRARRAIRSHMKKRGFAPQEIPPGTLAMLWEAMYRNDRRGEETRKDDG